MVSRLKRGAIGAVAVLLLTGASVGECGDNGQAPSDSPQQRPEFGAPCTVNGQLDTDRTGRELECRLSGGKLKWQLRSRA